MAVSIKSRVPVRGQEILAERPNGDRVWLLPYPTLLHDSSGRFVGAVNVLVDITELKNAQDALKVALVAKDDFLGQISHELRNPVLQVVGNVRLLRGRWPQVDIETGHAIIEDLHSASTRIQRLVENMLVLSRFERGMVPDSEPVLLQRVLVDTLDEFRRRFPVTEVQVDIPVDLAPVLTSASTVDQICWNLLTNAQKYGPPSGPIVVQAGPAETGVQLTVRDKGPGVPELEMADLFTPYFRASNTLAYAGGLGLGLSVCRRLMEANGGEMWARRLEPSGMEFGLQFKAAQAEGMD
jgi:signal transduction histidine kinase